MQFNNSYNISYMRYSMIYYDNELLLIFSFVDQLGRYWIFTGIL